jgi:hypothetical protein
MTQPLSPAAAANAVSEARRSPIPRSAAAARAMARRARAVRASPGALDLACIKRRTCGRNPWRVRTLGPFAPPGPGLRQQRTHPRHRHRTLIPRSPAGTTAPRSAPSRSRPDTSRTPRARCSRSFSPFAPGGRGGGGAAEVRRGAVELDSLRSSSRRRRWRTRFLRAKVSTHAVAAVAGPARCSASRHPRVRRARPTARAGTRSRRAAPPAPTQAAPAARRRGTGQRHIQLEHGAILPGGRS